MIISLYLLKVKLEVYFLGIRLFERDDIIPINNKYIKRQP